MWRFEGNTNETIKLVNNSLSVFHSQNYALLDHYRLFTIRPNPCFSESRLGFLFGGSLILDLLDAFANTGNIAQIAGRQRRYGVGVRDRLQRRLVQLIHQGNPCVCREIKGTRGGQTWHFQGDTRGANCRKRTTVKGLARLQRRSSPGVVECRELGKPIRINVVRYRNNDTLRLG